MRVAVWAVVGVLGFGCFKPAVEIICDPGAADACDTARGCAGVQRCNETGNAYSECECATGVGGGRAGEPDAGAGGGWQDIEVSPAARLELGVVSHTSSISGELVIRNVGLQPVPAEREKNLLLGVNGNAPYWSVSSVGGSQLSELCVGVFDSQTSTCTGQLAAGAYDPSVGLLADGRDELRLPIRLAPAGLGERTFQLIIRSNDPDEPSTTITISANSIQFPPCDVEVAPPSLDFGLIAPPGHLDLGVTIRNRRSGPNDYCAVRGVTVSGESLFTLPDGSASFVLAPSATKLVRVRASVRGQVASTPTPVQGQLVFDVDDPVQPRREVALTATVGAPCLLITPNSHDFRTVARGCNSTQRLFQVFNICTTEAVIDSAAMTLSRGEFQLGTGIPPGRLIVPGNQTPILFSARYHPVDEGLDLGAFVLTVTQDGRSQRYVVPLAGTGDQRGLNTENMIPGGTTGADVLLVIDDSGSMGDKQTALADNMAAFLQYATSNGIDFRIGVTNTELQGDTAAQAGLLRTSPGGRKFLTPSTPNLAAEFASLVRVGTTGYAESCMAPATRALTPPYSIDPSKNAGFLRNDALLAVVCVTDARDQAPLAASFYLDQMLNVRGAQRQGLFTYNVIGPFLPVAPSGCQYDDPNDGRHQELVRLTHGVKEEICTPNWSAKLTFIGTTTFGGARDTVYLASHPDLSMGLEVKVDGVLVPELDPQTMARHWAYEVATNSVTFNALALPPLGSTVSVTYLALCAP